MNFEKESNRCLLFLRLSQNMHSNNFKTNPDQTDPTHTHQLHHYTLSDIYTFLHTFTHFDTLANQTSTHRTHTITPSHIQKAGVGNKSPRGQIAACRPRPQHNACSIFYTFLKHFKRILNGTRVTQAQGLTLAWWRIGGRITGDRQTAERQTEHTEK